MLQLLLGGAGIGLAWRHLWIQSLPPDQVPACGMGIGYMFETLPFFDVIERTRRLRNGDRLSDVTADLARALGVTARVLPMSDDPVRTVVETDEGPLPFQHYFVARACKPR